MFTLTIDTTKLVPQETAGARYPEGRAQALKLLLRQVARRVASGEESGPVFNANGERIGRFEITEQR